MKVDNNLTLLCDTVANLAAAGIQTWIFGGWAEEIHRLGPSRSHKDIDLLYPANNFDLVDSFLRSIETINEGCEIVGKRFPHKRAFEWRGVTIEIFLVQHTSSGHMTDFFESYRHDWPPGTFDCQRELLGHSVRLASIDALVDYRNRHGAIEAAYRASEYNG